MSQATTSSTAVNGTGGRRRRRAAILVAIGMTLLIGGLLIGSRPWFIIAIIEPEMERILGGDVEIDDARWTGLGRMTISGVSVRVPNHAELPEPAGEVAFISRATVDVKLLPLLLGRLVTQALAFEDVTLRLAEDAREPGRFPLMELNPRFDLKTRRGTRPPRIDMRRVTLEAGEFDGDRYTVIGRRRASGSMHPMHGQDSTFTFELAEIDDRGLVIDGGLRINGRWDTETLAHAARIDGLNLDEHTLAMCPQIVRLWWQHMDLTGRVSEAKLDWTLGESFTFELAIEQVGLTLPEQADAFLVRYHDGRILEQADRPRMELHSGLIRWIDDGVELHELEGRVLSGDIAEDEHVHLPYRINLQIDDLPAMDFDERGQWLTKALEAAPFRMYLETGMDVTRAPLHRDPGASRAVDLPLPVARVFEQFQLADWSIDTQVEIWRDAPVFSADGMPAASPIRWRGELNINDGSLSVEQFKYRLRNVDAALRIDQNLILIEELHARGEASSRFTVDGTITLPTDEIDRTADPGFNINVVAVHLPLDEAFFAALPERNREFFNALFARSLYESFESAGFVGERAHDDDLADRLREIERAISERKAEDEEPVADPELIRQRDRLIAQLERGPIRLGGNAHLDLRLLRDTGPDQPTRLYGTIEPDAIGVFFERFPYPFTVISGKLEWSPQRVAIVQNEQTDGLGIILPGGGRGMITGGFDRPIIDGRRRLLPDLHINLTDEPMNELLAAAIPLTEHDREHLPDADQWPGRVFAAPARLLQGVGLTGTLSAAGHIASEPVREPADGGNDVERPHSEGDERDAPTHRTTYHFNINLDHGHAKPTAQLVEHIGAAGLFWPDGFSVRDVQGHLSVSDERIDLLGFHGWHGPGEVFATGRIDRVADPTTIALDVTLSDLDLHESIVNLVPREGLDTARELWQRYEPEGRFTANLALRETGDVRHPLEVTAVPTVCHVMIDDATVTFTGLGGKIGITAGDAPTVGFDALHINVSQGEEDHGDLTISGAYGVRGGDDNPLHVLGEWTNAAIESPVVLELMRLIGAERHRQWYADYSPSGRVDAAFDYESAAGVRRAMNQRDDADADAENPPIVTDPPHHFWLSLTPRELSFVLQQTPIHAEFDPASTAVLSPGQIQFNTFAGRVGESAFALNGDVMIDESIDATLHIDFDGRVASDEIMALFPEAGRAVVQQLAFDDGDRTEVRQSRLSLYGVPTTDGEVRGEYDWTVSYDGRLALNNASMQIGVPATEINGTFDLGLHITPHEAPKVAMAASFDSLRVIDRLITDVHVEEIRLSDDGTTMLIPSIRGRSYGGMVLAEATVGMREFDRYEMTVELAGLALSELYADHVERLASANNGTASTRSRVPRGEVFGGLKLAGQHGRPDSRSGRGTLRAVEGRIENIPMLLQIFNLLQLNAPLRGSLDQANAEFYIDGDRVIFERILFESTVADQYAIFQLIGRGSMDLKTMELATQFRSRGGMLVFRDLAGGLGDQLYLIEVTGTPADPKARLLPLPWLLRPTPPVLPSPQEPAQPQPEPATESADDDRIPANG